MQKPDGNSRISYFQNQELVSELVPGHKVLKFFYTNFFGKLLRLVFVRRWVSKLMGWYQSSSLSKKNIMPFIQEHGIDMGEFVKPQGGYTSFNDFFIRKIKGSARVIDADENALTSPADCKLFVIPDISQQQQFFIKNQTFDLTRFLGSQEKAQEYGHGPLMIFRLAPCDYHRFHFPAEGVARKHQAISGIFESVNPLVYAAGVQPLIENERHIITLQTKLFDDILVIPVGAMMVGKIIETYQPGTDVKKGDEAGYFAFGGSTVIVLCKRNMVTLREDIVANSQRLFETAVKMGEAVAHRI